MGDRSRPLLEKTELRSNSNPPEVDVLGRKSTLEFSEVSLEQLLVAEGVLTLPTPLPHGAPIAQIVPAFSLRGQPASQALVAERR